VTSTISRHVVSADWLQERLGEPGISVVDGSWYLPTQGRDARSEYDAGHIPGAVFFDQDHVVEPGSTLPHTLPTPGHFAQFAGSMGISDADTIVVYDGPGLFSAPRVWWMFKTMGAEKVYVLDGGFDRWRREGRPVSNAPEKVASCFFDARFDAGRVAEIEDVRQAVESGRVQIADARPAGRFTGAEPEPRAGMRSGHMPGARNLPAASLSREGSLLPLDELRDALAQAGIDPERPIIASCGSGVTAATIVLALDSLGHRNHRLYDGSWTEWAGRSDTPVVTGEAEPQ
jgi:thiosulfate/3-mercaptopyruvate sulfurtransferase